MHRRRKIDKWGGGAIFIYSCSQTLKQSISKEINNAEHEYMNMVPPIYRSFDAYEYMNVFNTTVQMCEFSIKDFNYISHKIRVNIVVSK
jgi:hypothetical protein